MLSSPDRPKGFRYPRAVIAHAVYQYHRFTLSYRDVQELLFKRDIDVSHEAIRSWCQRFGPEYAEGLRQREARHIGATSAVSHAWAATDTGGYRSYPDPSTAAGQSTTAPNGKKVDVSFVSSAEETDNIYLK